VAPQTRPCLGAKNFPINRGQPRRAWLWPILLEQARDAPILSRASDHAEDAVGLILILLAEIEREGQQFLYILPRCQIAPIRLDGNHRTSGHSSSAMEPMPRLPSGMAGKLTLDAGRIKSFIIFPTRLGV